jgi:hypothetical protein
MDPNIKQVFIDVHKWVRCAVLCSGMRARGAPGWRRPRKGGDAAVRLYAGMFYARRAMMTSSRPLRALPAPHRANEYVASPEEVAMLKESTVRIRRYALGG